MIEVITLDIEGTTSPISYVHEQLFPYSRERIGDWVRRGSAEIAEIVTEVRQSTAGTEADITVVTDILTGWIDADVKAPPLKALQGLIWEEGFASGELTSYVYDDVPPALERWIQQGRRVCVYSSGSELSQRLWFTHTQFGDLEHFISGHFDTRSAGPKQDPASYEAIARSLATPADRIAFLSDTAAELEAAHRAGWHAVGVSRADDGSPSLPGPVVVTSFDDLDLASLERRSAALPPAGSEHVSARG